MKSEELWLSLAVRSHTNSDVVLLGDHNGHPEMALSSSKCAQSVDSCTCVATVQGRVVVCMKATRREVKPQLQHTEEHVLGPGSPHFHQQTTHCIKLIPSIALYIAVRMTKKASVEFFYHQSKIHVV